MLCLLGLALQETHLHRLQNTQYWLQQSWMNVRCRYGSSTAMSLAS